MEKTPAVIVGAGILGCAIAHKLSERGILSYVLEKGPRIAEGVTSRNSGVVHAGLYYPPQSLKAQTCIRGAALLYEWCKKQNVPFRKTGKWIVGLKEELEELHGLYQNALNSGVKDLNLNENLPRGFLPGVSAEIGIFSPNTGTIDPYSYARSLQLAAEEKGAEFILNAEVTAIQKLGPTGFEIETPRGCLQTDVVFNTAGLYSDVLAKFVGVSNYLIHPCRGDYFKVRKSVDVKHHVYPIKKKNNPGLGVHITIGLDGSARLGPDAYYVSSRESFGEPVDLQTKTEIFLEAAKKLLPALTLDDLVYDSCGIRPKLRAPHEQLEYDFVLSQDLPGFINLVGIESPGLTAALDLAERAVALI